MRINVFGAAALAGVVATACPAAAAGPDVFIGGAVGPLHRSEATMQAWSAAAGIQHDLTPTLGLQGDLVFERSDYPVISADIQDFDAAAHLFHRQDDQFLIGGFVQGGTSVFSFKGGPTEFNRLVAGVDAQVYLDQLTLYGQIGVIRQVYPNLPQYSATGYFVTGEARYFITPNFKLDVHAGLSSMRSDTQPMPDAANFNLGLGAEYRLDESPLSLFGKIDTFQHTSTYSDRVTRVMVGLKGSFGTDTLLERDRGGITLKPVEGYFAVSPSPD